MKHWKVGELAAVCLLVGALLALELGRAARAQDEGGRGAAAGPRYSVMDTEGHNLIVTDNKTNTLYFYTTDKDQPVGSELKLRGTIDLNQVGKATIRPTRAKTE
jgi:hypothetical protein